MPRSSVRFGMLLLASLLFPRSSASAAIWRVDATGGGDFSTIQAAINASAAGDEVVVEPGSYVETVDFLGKNVLVRSANGPEQTDINGGGAAGCVRFTHGESAGAVLDGFTLTGGIGTNLPGLGSCGGAVLCLESCPTIRGCTIRDNIADYAGALYVRGSDPEIAACTFRVNVSRTSGGAIAGPQSSPSIHDCTFEANRALAGGGTILLLAPCEITRCVFLGNEASHGGAIAAYWGSDFFVHDCEFIGNAGLEGDGGAIWVHEASVTVERCLFARNTAVFFGGAVFVTQHNMAAISQCTFDANRAGAGGGAVGVSDDTYLVLTHSIFSRSISGGAVSSYTRCEIYFSATDTWDCGPHPYQGDAWNPPGENGNIAADPLYCNPASDDFSLCADSPCAGENNPIHGQIGLYPIGCGASASVATPGPRGDQPDLRAFPNPFRTSVHFRVVELAEEPGPCLIQVSAADGRRLWSRLLPLSSASEVIWEGVDNSGRQLPAGIYFARFVRDGRGGSVAKLIRTR